MKMKSYPLAKVYGLLEPGPVVMLTAEHKGKKNIMTLSWHTMMDFTPPLVGCVAGEQGYTFDLMKASRECVIAIPSVDLAEKVVRVGNTSGRDMDKFSVIELTPLPAAQVRAPLVAECFANLECRVVDTTLVNKYNFFVLEVVKAWIDPGQKEPATIHHRGKGVFSVDGRVIQLPSKMP